MKGFQITAIIIINNVGFEFTLQLKWFFFIIINRVQFVNNNIGKC